MAREIRGRISQFRLPNRYGGIEVGNEARRARARLLRLPEIRRAASNGGRFSYMLQFILRLWQRIKPWVERAEHAELIFGKTGFGAFLWKWIYPVVATITAAIVWLWAWWDKAPGYWRFVAALIALLSALALVYLFLKTLDWFRARGCQGTRSQK